MQLDTGFIPSEDEQGVAVSELQTTVRVVDDPLHGCPLHLAMKATAKEGALPIGPWFRSTLSLLLLGSLTVLCWWRIHLLADLRYRLWEFYAYFAAAFLIYLAGLWVVGKMGAVKGYSAKQTIILTAIVLLAALGARLALLTTTPSLSSDIYRYQWDGRVALAGIDPYAYAPSAPEVAFLRDETFERVNFPQLKTVYPPVAQFAFRLGAWLGPTLTAQKMVFVAFELVTVASLIAILALRRLSPLWVCAYAWHPLAILEFAGSGHNDALGIAFLWLGLALWHTRRWFGSTLAWDAAFLSKFMSIALIPWWWFRREARLWIAVFLLLAGFAFVIQPTAVSAIFESLSAMSQRVESNSSVFLVFLSLFGSASVAQFISICLGIGVLVWWGRRENDPVRYILGAFAAMTLLSPVVHPWYLTWLIPCFCFFRVPALLVFTGTVVLAYTVWPGYLAGSSWAIPVWARALEYLPVLLLGVWGIGKCALRSSFLPATKPKVFAKS